MRPPVAMQILPLWLKSRSGFIFPSAPFNTPDFLSQRQAGHTADGTQQRAAQQQGYDILINVYSALQTPPHDGNDHHVKKARQTASYPSQIFFRGSSNNTG